MIDPLVTRAQAWLDERADRLLADTQALLRLPTLHEQPFENAPFGKPCRDALDLCLGWGENLGWRTRDLEGFSGWMEFGSGDRMVATVGHLDVVPPGEGWKHDPWGAEVDGDYLYSRGAVDDKGPTVASIYAMMAVHAVWPDIPVRMRTILGCSEETGAFECIERYNKTEEQPTFGIVPDAGWPLYHGEKGIVNLAVSCSTPNAPFELRTFEGGTRPNIVIERCTAAVAVENSVREEVEEALSAAWDRNVEWRWKGDVLEIEATGKSAHGSTPYDGDSAAIRALRFLRDVAPLSERDTYQKLFHACHIGGAGIGVSGSDEPSGPLTSNVGIVSLEGGHVRLLLNIRYPVTWQFDELLAKARAHVAGWDGCTVELDGIDNPPLYFPVDHPLVTTVVDVVEVELGKRMEPGTMGGGTYARALQNSVAIGTGWSGDGPAHEADERIKVVHLLKMARIYAHILLGLAKV